jgi:chemotaxis protein MotA
VDIATIIGIVIAFGGILMGYIMEGGNPMALFGPTAGMIVIGGTIGATVIGTTLDDVKNIPKLLVKTFKPDQDKRQIFLTELVEIAELARRDGLLALENRQISDPFLKRAIMLVVDGTDPETVQDILVADLEAMEARHERGYGVFNTMGGFAPTMGIIGTVMGLVHVLGSLENPDDLGPSIAVAFIATLYGVGTANLVFLPIANKLKIRSKEEIVERTMVIEGTLAIQAGDNPRVLREKLSAHLSPAARVAKGEKKPAAKAAATRAAMADGGE